MRLVQLTVPVGKQRAVLSVLDERELDYVVTDETSDRNFASVVYVPLPTAAVEPVLDALREAGVGEEHSTTVVLDAETVVSRRFEQIQREYEEDGESEDRIAREEILSTSRDLVPNPRTYAVLTVISAVVATAGLLLDSPAVVVGSMVIAPLLGPAMAASVGTVTNERSLFVRGVKLQAVGFALAVLSSVGFAFVVKEGYLVPPTLNVLSIGQVNSRSAPDFLSLAVALGAGVAGALSLSAGISAALVGVMIAAALIPPTAAIGIGIVWGLPSVVFGSAVLVLVNVLSINLSALLVLWYAGYRPRNWYKEDRARRDTIRSIAVMGGSIGLLSVALGGATYTSLENANARQRIQQVTTQVLGESRYQQVTLLDLTVEYHQGTLFRRIDRVVVTVGRPAGEDYPDLATTLKSRIADVVDTTPTVQVRLVDIEQA